MSVKRTGANVKDDLERIVKAITDNADRVRTVTFNTVKGEMARRIWNQGMATDGSRIGNYKPATKKRRNEAGLRIDMVDLSVSQVLNKSFVIGQSQGRTVIGIEDKFEPKISVKNDRVQITGTSDFVTSENAIVQEKNFNKEIFAPSKEELERGEKTVIKEINLVVQKALRQS